MTTKSSFLVVIFAITWTVFTACGTSKSAASAEVSKIQPKFDYVPKGAGKVGSAGMTIALISPSFLDQLYSINPFEDMRKNMANDFEELLTAKGFKIRGPFEGHGEMLHDDKQNSDFVFEVEIDLDFKGIDRKRRTVTSTNWGRALNPYDTRSSTNVSYMYQGEGNIVCNLVLTAKSTNFSEKIWKKNITLPATPFKYVGSAEKVGFWMNGRVCYRVGPVRVSS